MSTFFTSDHHFGHAKIIEYCKRPFSSVEEMNQVMIDRWNEVVGPDDHVYHLGDFAFGHNDVVERYRHTVVHLIHRPFQGWSIGSERADVVLNGHVHDSWKFKDRNINVGVDQWDFRPQTLKTLVAASIEESRSV